MYVKKPYMIPVNPHVTKEPIEKVVVGKQLSNVTDIEERAKSDLKDDIDDDKPHVPINIKGTKMTVSVKLATGKATSTQKKRKRKESKGEFTIFKKKSRK